MNWNGKKTWGYPYLRYFTSPLEGPGEANRSGVQNQILAPGTTNSCYGFIGAGRLNTICNQGASIVGGSGNTVSVIYSSVLGGSGNNDNGVAYAGIYGHNITANTSCAFHANNFVAANMPTSRVGLNPGALWYCSTDCSVHIVP
jgi:hypothetical protein